MNILVLRVFILLVCCGIFSACESHQHESVIDSDMLFGFKQTDEQRDSITTALKPYIEEALLFKNTYNNRNNLNILLSKIRITRDSTAFKLLSKKAKEFANVSNDAEQLARTYYNIGAYSEMNYTFDTAYASYIKAAKLYKKLGNTLKRSENEYYQARVLFQKGLTVEAESRLLEVLDLLDEKYQNTYIYFEVTRGMGTCLLIRGENTAAMKYFQKCLALLHKNKFVIEKEHPGHYDVALAVLYGSFSKAYTATKQYNKAIECANIGLKLIQNQHVPTLKYCIEIHKSIAQFELKPNAEALEPLIEAYAEASTKGLYFDTFNSSIYSGLLYAILKDNAKASYWYKRAYDFGKEQNSMLMQKLALEPMLQLQDHVTIEEFNEVIALNNAVQKEKLNAHVQFSHLTSGTKVLLLENSRLREQITVIVTTGILLILTLLILLYLLRLRSKNAQMELIASQSDANASINQLIFERGLIAVEIKKNERIRIARDLHDFLVNGLFMVRFNLELLDISERTTKDGMIKELCYLEKYARDLSHELLDNDIFNENRFVELIEDYVKFQVNNWGTKFTFLHDDTFDYGVLRGDDKVNVFYIIREAIQNVNKHSEADVCIVKFVKVTDSKLRISIIDNGIGISVTDKKGVGLVNIQERTNAMNAKVLFTKLRPTGTSITFDISIE